MVTSRNFLPYWNWKYRTKCCGVSNIVSGKYCIIFYDYDSHHLTKKALRKIYRLFKNDIIMFTTEKGFHFVSFTIIKKKPKKLRKKVSKYSRKLNQDFRFHKRDYLVLRISPKILDGKIIVEKPIYWKTLQLPKPNSPISLSHLLCYMKSVGLPDYLMEYYFKHCRMIRTTADLHFYKTKNPEVVKSEK